jgi:hypothetical protein
MSQQAEKLVTKGDNILSKKIYLGNKLKDASNAYEEAATLYRNQKMHIQAAEVYQKLADVLEKMGQSGAAASAYKESANQYDACALFEGMGYDACIDSLRKAAAIYTQNGKNAMAAAVFKELAEKLQSEEDEGSVRGAIMAWREAYERYETDNAYPSMNNALVNIAELCSMIKDFKKAASTWDELLYADWNKEKRNSAASTTTRLALQKYIFSGTLCRLANMKSSFDKDDIEIIQMGFVDKQDVGNNFQSSREYELLMNLCTALEKKDKIIFTKAVRIANDSMKLSDLTTNILLSIKKVLEESLSSFEDPDLT